MDGSLFHHVWMFISVAFTTSRFPSQLVELRGGGHCVSGRIERWRLAIRVVRAPILKMEGETGSSSQQQASASASTPIAGISASTASVPSMVTPSTGGAVGATTAMANLVSAQQNPQQQQSGVGSSREPSAVPASIGVQQQQPNAASSSAGHQMHPNMVQSSAGQPNFQAGQPRPGVIANRGRQQQVSPYPHFASLSPSTAMHQQQRGGVPMQGGMGPQQRPSALGAPYVHNMQQHPRASMIGQPQGTPHSSIVPSGQTDPLSNIQPPYTSHQSRQKQGSIQGTPFQHSASSGQTLPGMQTIGTVGTPPLGSQIRPSGVFGHGQQRPGQAQLRSQSPSQHQSLTSQKMHAQNLQRMPSMGSMNSQLSGISQGQSGAPSSALSHQQQWMPTQGKQLHSSGMPLTSPSYPSHLKQQGLPQRSQHTQTQQQSLPMAPQQQPHQLQEQHSQQYQHQRVPQPLHGVQQQQQMSRTPGMTTQKIPTSAAAQPSGMPASGNTIPAGSHDQAIETSSRILGKRSIRELVAQIDPSEKLDSEVEDILIEVAEDFVDKVTNFACCLAKHRKSETLEPKDILLHLERNWNMTIPGFAGDEYRIYKRPSVNENHKQRLSMIRKSVATSQTGTETGNTKESTGQVTGNANSKVPTTKGSREVSGAQENS